MILTKPRSSRRSPPFIPSANQNGRGIVITAGSALSLFRETKGLDWVDSREKARPASPFRFPSAIHRRQRFWTRERLDPERNGSGGRSSLARSENALSKFGEPHG
jgi:hypothetical protein